MELQAIIFFIYVQHEGGLIVSKFNQKKTRTIQPRSVVDVYTNGSLRKKFLI